MRFILEVTIHDVHDTIHQLLEKKEICQTSNGTYRIL
jgi:hypothetical protein